SGVVNFDTDPVTGLQRDELHVSYSIGRYIAALTFVETLVPENERRGDPLSVGVRRPENAEPLPDEYKETAQAAVSAALASVGNEGDEKYASVDLTAYKVDPADTVAELLVSSPQDVYLPPDGDPASVIKDQLAVDLPSGAEIEADVGLLERDGDTGSVPVTLTYGYKSVGATLSLNFIDHEHNWEIESNVYVHGAVENKKTYKCPICGKEKEKTFKQEPCFSRDFSDVPPYGDWSHEGIDFCVRSKLMTGVSSSRFNPGGVMTRAMLVTVLWRYAGQPESSVKAPFKDLKADWYRDAVRWAYENSVVNGTSGTAFSPDDPLTREQIATILFRFTGASEQATEGAELSGFRDFKKISGYAKDAMAWAYAAGLINGVGTASGVVLDPLGNATRAQVAAILYRFLTK
ncbi:MAG: S-layer homology domain-containing protein, partial [Clostridia bacterium]|nr:S-layer homology domain-containing protein [Clostridia bacterium]